MKRNETFHSLVGLLVPSRGEADTVQGELVRSLARLKAEFNSNGNMNWEPRSGNGHDLNYFQEKMYFLWAVLTEEPSEGFLEVFDTASIQQIQRDLGHLNLSALMVAALPAPKAMQSQILAASHTDSEPVIWERVKLYVGKWFKAHSALQNERVQTESVQFVGAFRELYSEWSVHGNIHWDSEPDMFGGSSGSAFYQGFVKYLWLHLLPASSPLLKELDFEATQKFQNSFNNSELQSISRDLVFINLLGLLHGFMRVETEQAASILEAALPKDSEETVFGRLEERVVKWCQMNPKLVALYANTPEIEARQTTYSQLMASI